MKLLIIITVDAHHVFLVALHTEQLKREVKNLIAKRKNSAAMVTALLKGRLERQVDKSEVRNIKADMLLSENNVSWDLTNR